MIARWVSSRRAFLAAGASALAGCNVLPKVNEPVPLYDLVAPIKFDRSFAAEAGQLVVGVPIASADLDNTRIALSRRSGIIEYFGKGAWADHAPVLIQGRLVEAFEINGAIGAVGRDAAGLMPDLVLHTELRDFQAEYSTAGAPPNGHVRLSAKLIAMPQRRIVYFLVVEHYEPAQGQALSDIVRALDIATSRVVIDVVSGVLGALN